MNWVWAVMGEYCAFMVLLTHAVCVLLPIHLNGQVRTNATPHGSARRDDDSEDSDGGSYAGSETAWSEATFVGPSLPEPDLARGLMPVGTIGSSSTATPVLVNIGPPPAPGMEVKVCRPLPLTQGPSFSHAAMVNCTILRELQGSDLLHRTYYSVPPSPPPLHPATAREGPHDRRVRSPLYR